MPASEVKQRKKTQKPNEESERPNDKCEDEIKKENAAEEVCLDPRKTSLPSSLDLRTITCLLSLAVCSLLAWVVLQQNEKFTEVEEKYKVLYGKTASLLEMEQEVVKMSKKLATSEDDLQGALSAASLATRLQQDVASLQAAVAAMETDENSASRHLQEVSGRFQNVTETWRARLDALTSDLARLKAEAREAHAGATGRVNEAERRAGALAERLDELEDSTRRNARALERTEDDDAKRARDQLDWNTEQIHKMEERVRALHRADQEMSAQLGEHVPRARQCEAALPAVEDAVRSILRLGADLSATERRLEELTLQVFGTEDSMLKALTQIVDLRQGLDALHAHSSLAEMKNELGMVTEAVRALRTVVMSVGSDRAEDSGREGGEGEEEEEEEEEQQQEEEKEKEEDLYK